MYTPVVFAIFLSISFSNLSLLEFWSVVDIATRLWSSNSGSIFFSWRLGFVGLFFLSIPFALISDVINSTDYISLAKGVGALLVFPCLTLFLIAKLSALQVCLAGIVYSLLSPFFGQAEILFSNSQELFKWYLSTPLFFLIISLLFFLSPRISQNHSLLYVSSSSGLIAITSLIGNLRLLALVSLLAFLFTCIKAYLPQMHLVQFFSHLFAQKAIRIWWFLPFFILILSLSLSFIGEAIIFILRVLDAPEIALQKTSSQLSGSLGLLFGGRPEAFGAFAAFVDKPFFGWGSWAVDRGWHYFLLSQEIYSNLGYQKEWLNELLTSSPLSLNKIPTFNRRYIPTHSLLLNVLVWYGGFAFIPIYSWFCLFIKSVFSVSAGRNILALHAVSLSFFYSCWTIIFSPFGYSNRVLLSLLIAFCVTATTRTPAPVSSLAAVPKNTALPQFLRRQ